MTDRQSKFLTHVILALRKEGRIRRKGAIYHPAFPRGEARQLVWFERIPGNWLWVTYETMPVIVGSTLAETALDIEEGPYFHKWGINPWTGEMADLKFNF